MRVDYYQKKPISQSLIKESNRLLNDCLKHGSLKERQAAILFLKTAVDGAAQNIIPPDKMILRQRGRDESFVAEAKSGPNKVLILRNHIHLSCRKTSYSFFTILPILRADLFN